MFGFYRLSLRCLFGRLALGLLCQSLLDKRMLLGDGLFFRADFAFEAVVQIKTFSTTRQGFEVAGAAAMVGEDAGDQCRIVLRQRGNKVLVDADGQRFESFEDVDLP